MGDEKGNLVVVDIVGKLRQNSPVHRNRLILEQARFRGDHGALVLGARFFEDAKIHQARLLDIQFRQAKIEVGQIALALGPVDQILGDRD